MPPMVMCWGLNQLVHFGERFGGNIVPHFLETLIKIFKSPREGHGDVLYFLVEKSNGISQTPVVSHQIFGVVELHDHRHKAVERILKIHQRHEHIAIILQNVGTLERLM
jgi:hypothetical protein